MAASPESIYAADVANEFNGINEVIPVRGFNYRQFGVADGILGLSALETVTICKNRRYERPGLVMCLMCHDRLRFGGFLA